MDFWIIIYDQILLDINEEIKDMVCLVNLGKCSYCDSH